MDKRILFCHHSSQGRNLGAARVFYIEGENAQGRNLGAARVFYIEGENAQGRKFLIKLESTLAEERSKVI